MPRADLSNDCPACPLATLAITAVSGCPSDPAHKAPRYTDHLSSSGWNLIHVIQMTPESRRRGTTGDRDTAPQSSFNIFTVYINSKRPIALYRCREAVELYRCTEAIALYRWVSAIAFRFIGIDLADGSPPEMAVFSGVSAIFWPPPPVGARAHRERLDALLSRKCVALCREYDTTAIAVPNYSASGRIA